MLRVLKTGKPAIWGAKKDEKEWAVANRSVITGEK